MDNAVQALMIAFGLLVLVIALSVSVYMFTQVTSISENLLYFADKTNYYDSITYDKNSTNIDEASTERAVDLDTIIPTLYRYNKENFCVKIYDATDNYDPPTLIQVFDINIENKVRRAIADNEAKSVASSNEHKVNYAYKQIYNNEDNKLYMFGAPWTGSTDDIKKRVDYFIAGEAGYINDVYVDYSDNNLYNYKEGYKFKERFISYSYTGSTFITDEGDEIVNTDSKDKNVIIYTIY